MHLSHRCWAQTRNGSRCRSPAMPNDKCRMHGGASPGGPRGKANGATGMAALRRRRSSAAANWCPDPIMQKTARDVD